MKSSPRRALGVGALAIAACVASWVFVACVGDDPGEEQQPTTEAGPPATGKDIGVPCGTGTECTSTLCVDGVCCDKACNGMCEACNVAGSVGRCAAVPAGQDPDKECKTTPPVIPDAGTVDPDAASPDGSTTIDLPDGGLVGDSKLCAGSCDGARACTYPDSAKTCGTTFCSDTSHRRRMSCDGKGNCATIVSETCTAFSCESKEASGECRTTCASPADCLSTHYCNGATNKCEKKKVNQIQCSLATECESGYCNGESDTPSKPTVCCDTECSGAAFTCIAQGNVGKCICPACPGGQPCKLYYQDADGDGFGNKNGKVADGTAKYGCAAGPPPGTGVAPDKWVADHSDCYDVADANGAKVHPGQTGFFNEGYGANNANFDYDCDGSVKKQWYDSLSGCQWCDGSLVACGGGGGGGGGDTCKQKPTCPSTTKFPGHRCGPSGNLQGQLDCEPLDGIAFEQLVGCGGTANLMQCHLQSRCTVVGGGSGGSSLYKANARQGCR